MTIYLLSGALGFILLLYLLTPDIATIYLNNSFLPLFIVLLLLRLIPPHPPSLHLPPRPCPPPPSPPPPPPPSSHYLCL